jgi:hypothetical protein
VKTRFKTLERGIAQIDPLAEEDPRSLAADSNPEELLTSILSASKPERREKRRGGASRTSTARWRRPAIIAAPAAAAALLALTVGIPGGGSGGETLSALTRVAKAAAAQPAPDTDSPFQFVKTREIGISVTAAGGQAWGVLESSTSQRWIGKDGSGLVRRELDTPQWASPDDKKAWEASGRIPFLAHGWKPYVEEHRYGLGHFGDTLYVTPERPDYHLADLPTDPEKLAAWLEGAINDPESEDNGSGPTVRTMTLVTDLLAEPSASPELRSALYQALGTIPGIESFGEVTDAAGRSGVAVGIDSAYSGAPTRYMVIFDPETSQVLAIEEIWLERPSGLRGEASEKAPVLSSATLFLESRGADSLGG